MLNTIAQIIGVFGLICSLLSFQMKNRKWIMAFQMTASLSFSAQLFMLGAITGGCVDMISFIRTMIFSQNSKKWASSPVWLYVFLGIMIIAGALTWQNAWDILPIIGSMLSTLALWMKREKHIRLISLSVGPCWLVYNLVKGAWSGALNEVLAMTSIVIGMIRNDTKKADKTETN
ncbi:MAG: YgjV family protein [Clostridia bacterium]|nr:YgjV family protein [Clostridia bacterium]